MNISKTFLEEIPIPEKNEKNKHSFEKVVHLVKQLLQVKKQKAEVVTERDVEYLNNKGFNIEVQINDIIYELYELTPDEINVAKELLVTENVE